MMEENAWVATIQLCTGHAIRDATDCAFHGLEGEKGTMHDGRLVEDDEAAHVVQAIIAEAFLW